MQETPESQCCLCRGYNDKIDCKVGNLICVLGQHNSWLSFHTLVARYNLGYGICVSNRILSPKSDLHWYEVHPQFLVQEKCCNFPFICVFYLESKKDEKRTMRLMGLGPQHMEKWLTVMILSSYQEQACDISGNGVSKACFAQTADAVSARGPTHTPLSALQS